MEFEFECYAARYNFTGVPSPLQTRVVGLASWSAPYVYTGLRGKLADGQDVCLWRFTVDAEAEAGRATVLIGTPSVVFVVGETIVNFGAGTRLLTEVGNADNPVGYTVFQPGCSEPAETVCAGGRKACADLFATPATAPPTLIPKTTVAKTTEITTQSTTVLTVVGAATPAQGGTARVGAATRATPEPAMPGASPKANTGNSTTAAASAASQAATGSAKEEATPAATVDTHDGATTNTPQKQRTGDTGDGANEMGEANAAHEQEQAEPPDTGVAPVADANADSNSNHHTMAAVLIPVLTLLFAVPLAFVFLRHGAAHLQDSGGNPNQHASHHANPAYTSKMEAPFNRNNSVC